MLIEKLLEAHYEEQKKRRKIILVIFLLLFVIGFGYFAIREYAVKPFLHHDNSLFEEGKYKEDYGGEYADIFFQEATSIIQNSNKKEFYYLDGVSSLRLLHYCDSVFYLEITPNDYENDKEALMNTYTLLDNDKFEDHKYLLVGKSYSKDQYYFFTVDSSTIPSLSFGKAYPSCFGMIGYNDTSKTLCMVFFYSPSLDCIGSMDDFMNTNLFFIF